MIKKKRCCFTEEKPVGSNSHLPHIPNISSPSSLGIFEGFFWFGLVFFPLAQAGFYFYFYFFQKSQQTLLRSIVTLAFVVTVHLLGSCGGIRSRLWGKCHHMAMKHELNEINRMEERKWHAERSSLAAPCLPVKHSHRSHSEERILRDRTQLSQLTNCIKISYFVFSALRM